MEDLHIPLIETQTEPVEVVDSIEAKRFANTGVPPGHQVTVSEELTTTSRTSKALTG